MLGKEIRETKLDREECYRIRDLQITRGELKLYFTDGFLMFSKPVAGERRAAIFSGEVEGGDAELLVLPPTASERRSLGFFTETPNLDEHFRSALMLFSDGTGEELMAKIREAGPVKKSPEMALMLGEKWDSVLSSFLASFEVRLVEEMLSTRGKEMGFFYCAIGGSARLNNFDMIYDPRAREQVSIGQVAYRDNRTYFDMWTSFVSRDWRQGGRKPAAPEYKIEDVRIDATIDAELKLAAVTKMKVTPRERTRTLAFDLSRLVDLKEARIDGKPAELYSPESLRANLLRSLENTVHLVVNEGVFEPGRTYELEFHHEGNTILPAGNKVYFVSSRGAWYPNRPVDFATYDLTFRYPKELVLVSTGDLISETVEGEQKISRRATTVPVRVVGFNLGDFEKQGMMRGGYRIDVYANRTVEPALQSKQRQVEIVTPPSVQFPRQRRPQQEVMVLPTPDPRPVTHLQQLAEQVANGFEFMASRFGPPPLKTITVAPIPGRFGQGFPGLIYLSTLSYLDPRERPKSVGREDLFFSELLHAHETAHQWWGNVVTTDNYGDEWLMEALANYSSLLFLESKKGAKALDSVLEQYRVHLMAKDPAGRTVESAGPITLGHRLQSSQSPAGWGTIVYEKGSWILHMLRRRMGDEQFTAMLKELFRRYQYKAVTTEQFRSLAAEFAGAAQGDTGFQSFFDQWVYGTGIPTLKLNYTVEGKAPKVRLKGTVTQSDVDEDFSIQVPVEIQTGRGKPMVQWVRTGNEAATFTVNLAAAPVKVLLDPGGAVLMNRK